MAQSSAHYPPKSVCAWPRVFGVPEDLAHLILLATSFSTCTCKSSVDIHGDHLLICELGLLMMHHHDALRYIM